MYALYLADDKRILHVTEERYVTNVQTDAETVVGLLDGYVLADSLPEGDMTHYLYVNGEYVYDPLQVCEPAPSQLDAIEAQVIYTAMMTDTLLEV